MITPMQWTVAVLVVIIALLLLVVIWQADRAQPGMPTRKQRAQWKRKRLELSTQNRIVAKGDVQESRAYPRRSSAA